MDPDVRELLGYKDCWLRDKNGDRIPELIWHAPSTDLVQTILQAHSKKYRRQTSISMDVNNRVSGGEMIVGRHHPTAPSSTTHPAPFPLFASFQDTDPPALPHHTPPPH